MLWLCIIVVHKDVDPAGMPLLHRPLHDETPSYVLYGAAEGVMTFERLLYNIGRSHDA